MEGAEVVCESDDPCMAGYCDAEEGCVFEPIQGCEEVDEDEDEESDGEVDGEEDEGEQDDSLLSGSRLGCAQSAGGTGNFGVLSVIILLGCLAFWRRRRV